MTTQAHETSVRTQIVVEVPIERAFSVFTEKFDSIKPREHNMLAVDIAETVFEPREGGRIYDRGVDGSECQWARVLAFEPPNRVVFSWDISPQWQIESDPDKTSEVEVRFIPRRRNGRASSSSTATSTATARAGKARARASARATAGRCTCRGSPSWRSISPGGPMQRSCGLLRCPCSQPSRSAAEPPGSRPTASRSHMAGSSGRVSIDLQFEDRMDAQAPARAWLRVRGIAQDRQSRTTTPS